MKSKNKLNKIIVFLLLLTVIAMIFVANTYSKYATNASGSDSVVVAKWSFLVNDEEIAVTGDAKTIDFNLFETIYDSDGESEESDVAEGFIAPGTSGAFEFALQNTSEVTAQYAINLTVDNTDIPLEFSFDAETWTDDLSNLVAQDNLAIGASKNVKVEWRWAFGADTVTDAALGGQTVNVSATITAIQLNNSDITTSGNVIDVQVFEGLDEEYADLPITKTNTWIGNHSPFIYKTNYFAGETISKIGIPVSAVKEINDNQTFTLYTFNNSLLSTGFNESQVNNTYKIKLPLSEIEDATYNSEKGYYEVNKWIYVDVNIPVAETENLAIGAFDLDPTTNDITATDTVYFAYHLTPPVNDSKFHFYAQPHNPNGMVDVTSQNIMFDFYVKKTETVQVDNSLSGVLARNNITNFSILGDSICTYDGVTNVGTTSNSNIQDNAIFYTSAFFADVEETWWRQFANEGNIDVLVNNSYAGHDVVETLDANRYSNLHDNTGDNAGTTPDLIAIYLGINDYGWKESSYLGDYSSLDWDTLIVEENGSYTYATPTSFVEAYPILLHKTQIAYPDADIFAFTFVPTDLRVNKNLSASMDEAMVLLEEYNDVVRDMTSKFKTRYGMDISIVDLFNDSGITSTNYKDYSIDPNAYFTHASLHPNYAGMDAINNTFKNAVIEKYSNN